MVQLMTGRGQSPFGLDSYTIPKTDIILSRPRTTKIVNDKIVPFIDMQAKMKNFVPPPNKYEMFFNWKDPAELKKKGHFSKQPRITFTESILKNPRLKEWPGPASYKVPKSEFDTPGTKNQQKGADKMCAFISEAQYRSIQTPSPGHFNYNYVRSFFKNIRI